MASTELERLVLVRRRLRWRYEWTRGWRALLGASPVWLLIGAVVALAPRPEWSLLAGGSAYALGAVWLWRGRELACSVLPGIGVGLIPLGSALAVNAMGHVCLGERCTSLCLPACACGGLVAGFWITRWAARRAKGKLYWLGASAIAMCVGAMGCACVGSAGIIGMALGYLSGLALFRAKAGLTSGEG